MFDLQPPRHIPTLPTATVGNPMNERLLVAVAHSKAAVPVSARSRQKLSGNGAPIPVIKVTQNASRNRTSSRRLLVTRSRRVTVVAFVAERRVIPMGRARRWWRWEARRRNSHRERRLGWPRSRAPWVPDQTTTCFKSSSFTGPFWLVKANDCPSLSCCDTPLIR